MRGRNVTSLFCGLASSLIAVSGASDIMGDRVNVHFIVFFTGPKRKVSLRSSGF